MNLLIEIESQTSGIGHCVIYFKVERIELFEGPSVFMGMSIRLHEHRPFQWPHVSLVARGTLQIRIRFVGQRSNPTLETNKKNLSD